MLQRAVDLDANFAPTFTFLAVAHMHDYVNEWSASPSRSLELAHEFAERAVALDDTHPYQPVDEVCTGRRRPGLIL